MILVADGARADLMKDLLDSGRLPNMERHIVGRGCYRTALTVFPSTTGPAHIPFVSGLHPGTANIPGYRWLCRSTHDRKKRSIYRHRSLNSPRGLIVGRDMDRDKSTSLYEYFEKPSSVLELIDYCPNQPLSKIVVRRLLRIGQAHHSDDWGQVDKLVERQVIKRIKAGSECIIGSFFGIDEYSHLYDPFDERTIGAYLNMDRAIGEIVETLKQENVYDQTIIAIVSDHGLSATRVHIPMVDMVKEHGFKPHYYPKLFRKECDSAVLESGNAMAQLYFKRDQKWGEHWTYSELINNSRTAQLLKSIEQREGISFWAARDGKGGVVISGRAGSLKASPNGKGFVIETSGENPLLEHPTGEFSLEELFHTTYDHTYPDAVNQIRLLFTSARSGDVAVSSEPGYDLRLQHEDPEHHSSHGSLHREHMQVPLMISVPIDDEKIYNYDLPPTILALTGKTPMKPMDGRVLSVNGHLTAAPSQAVDEDAEGDQETASGGGLSSILITIGIILSGIIVTVIFRNDIMGYGTYVLTEYGQDWVDLILFALTAVSSTPLAVPIWPYALVGISLGFSALHMTIVMALGSATGSVVTYLVGRYFGNTQWVKKRFPKVHKHPWTTGKSRWYVTLLLFLGTASPIPCDVFYAACGVKNYPIALFWPVMVAARSVRYGYLSYGFIYFQDLFKYAF